MGPVNYVVDIGAGPNQLRDARKTKCVMHTEKVLSWELKLDTFQGIRRDPQMHRQNTDPWSQSQHREEEN